MNDSESYRPIVLKGSDKKFSENFEDLKKKVSEIGVRDFYLEQQRELIKIDNPLNQSVDRIKEIQESLNAGKELIREGCWIYYPWRAMLVHTLNEADFIKLRTSRNLYKITKAEQDILTHKKVGIIGLSVGHAVAMTLALERSVGELRLADFDTLELSNLNRIRSALLNVGLPKTVIAAREIAELDPFIKVTCFEKGITEDNLHEFFTNEGKLDALVEECDSLDIKILSRIKARELGIPVLMETSDRGMIDIERFDLESDRPILHGLIEHLDYQDLKGLKSSEDKIPFLMPMVGIETMSPRLKASALEVGHSISTWPQLGTSVMLGGAILSDTYRRIMLGQIDQSGRFIVDPAQVIAPKEEKVSVEKIERERGSLSKEDMLKDISILNREKVEEIDHDVIKEIVKAGGSAPSGGNAQPWKWIYQKGRLYLFLDKSSSDSFMDYRYSASYIALGAAYENARIMAGSLGYQLKTTYFPLSNNVNCVCEIVFEKGDEKYSDLANEVYNRYTDRRILEKKTIGQDIIDHFNQIISEFPEFESRITDNTTDINTIAEVVSSGDWLRIMNPESHRDFTVEEMRWTKDQLEKEKNGIFVGELSLSHADLAGLYLLKDDRVIDFMNQNHQGHGLKNISAKIINASSLLLTVFSDEFSEKKFFDAGVLMERLWLYCTKENIGFQVINVPIAFLLRYKDGALSDLDEVFKNELNSMVQKMESIVKDYSEKTDLLFIRLFRTTNQERTSVRREINQILEFE